MAKKTLKDIKIEELEAALRQARGEAVLYESMADESQKECARLRKVALTNEEGWRKALVDNEKLKKFANLMMELRKEYDNEINYLSSALVQTHMRGSVEMKARNMLDEVKDLLGGPVEAK